jgi:hypothetical protein
MRAQVVLQGKSGKPEDVFVNTYHFVATSGGIGDAGVIRDHLVELYNVVPPGAGLRAIASDLSNVCLRTANASKVKVYNLADPMPRIPFSFDWTLGPSLAATGIELPAELAVCVSYYATLNRPRMRGRAYIGPWVSVQEDVGTTERSRPPAVIRDSLAATFKRLIDKPAEVVQLAVYSTVDSVARVVTNGWVDDAWDIQRRRGQDAETRTLFAGA